jgi:protein TonB
MTLPSESILACARPLPVRWPRVGALSTSFSLHGVAAAVFLMAVSAPRVELHQPKRMPPPSLSVTVVEPTPPAAPLPPTAAAAPVAAAVVPAVAIDPAPTPIRVAPALPAAALPAPALALPASVAATPATVAASARVDYGTVSRPPYPAAALRRGAEGEVLVRVQVGSDGRVGRLELARSSGDRDLDRAALAAVRGWRFQPAQTAGAPVAAWVVVPVVFQLDRR